MTGPTRQMKQKDPLISFENKLINMVQCTCFQLFFVEVGCVYYLEVEFCYRCEGYTLVVLLVLLWLSVFHQKCAVMLINIFVTFNHFFATHI